MDNDKKRLAINPPGEINPSDPEYLRLCGFSLEPSIHQLIEAAVEAGWVREDVVAAILIETGRHLECNKLVFSTLDDACNEERFIRPNSAGQGRVH